MPDSSQTLLKISDLSAIFNRESGSFAAVRNLSLNVAAGKVTCLVGESGCGKSLTCKSVLRLEPPGVILEGSIIFKDQDLLRLSEKSLCSLRGSEIGMIFQEPMTSLNPVLTIGSQTEEPLRLHLKMKKREAKEKVIELFSQVGIPAPELRYNDYPHQLSGGMRQRVMIAMAISCSPSLLLADEPTTALDATIQGQILRLLLHESQTRDMALLLITHDLGVVADMADYVGVMYAGILAEMADVRELFINPLHPYTKALLACAPGKASWQDEFLPVIAGHVPSLETIPSGCPFAPRCDYVMPVCRDELPPVFESSGHKVCCWLWQPGFQH